MDVSGLKPDLNYEFKVYAENKMGSSEPASTRSVKYSADNNVRFDKPLSDVTITKFPATATFECSLNKPGVPITWYKGSEPISRSRPKYVTDTSHTGHRLTIRDVSGGDEGVYSAAFKNQKVSANLDLKVPPTLSSSHLDKSIVLKEGETVSIEIPFSCWPTPKVAWTLNGRPLYSDHRVSCPVNKDSTTLKISRADLKDAGQYRVVVENPYGKSSVDLDVKVLGKPSIPENLEVTEVTENSVSLKWRPPLQNGGKPITRYVIERRDKLKSVNLPVGTSDRCEYRVIRLITGNEYVLRVSAENEVGQGPAAEVALTVKSQFSPPSPPRRPLVSDVKSNSMQVSWSPPDDSGGCPLTGYLVERRSDTSRQWVFVNKEPIPDTSSTVGDLYEGTTYEFRVTAVNKVGSSKPSEVSKPVTAESQWKKPGKPGSPKARRLDDTSYDVTWTPPMSDGGLPIISYLLENCEDKSAYNWRPVSNGNDGLISDTKYLAKGLKSNIDYRFRVSAQNKMGFGPSSESDWALDRPKPSEPPRLLSHMKDQVVTSPDIVTFECNVIPGSRDVQIKWYKDSREIRPSRKYDTFFWDNKASLVVKETEPGDGGRYRCEIVNGMGVVDDAAILTVYKHPEIEYDSRLKQPIFLKAGKNLDLDLTFTGFPTPTCDWTLDGGHVSTGGRCNITSGPSHSYLRINNVQPSDSGTYKVKVANKAGSRIASFDVFVKDKPSAPRNLRVNDVTSDSVEISWDRSLHDGGSPITAYVVEKRDASKNNWIGTSRTLPDVTKNRICKLWEGCNYLFRVAAENEVGLSEFVQISQPITAKPPYTTPDAPMNLRASDITRNSIRLTWSEPLNDGGSPIDHYIIESRSPYNPRWTKVSTGPNRNLECHVRDLVDGEKEFRVIAVNEAGSGRPSDSTGPIKIKDPFERPAPPGLPEISPLQKDKLILKWSRPLFDGGCPILGYKVEMRPIGTFYWQNAHPTSVKDTSLTLQNLLPETDYEFRVMAENKAGLSNPSGTVRTQKYADEPIQFKRPLSNLRTTTIGQPVTFECEVTKPEKVAHWLKDGFDLKPGPKYDMGMDGGSYRLTVRDVDSRDVGDYAVVIKGHRSEARLDVEASPQIRHSDRFMQPLVLKAGTSASVEVPFTGSPQPKIIWNYEGRPLRESRRVRVDNDHDLTTLILSRVDRSDAGTYSLKLENDFGSGQLKVKVIVIDKPSPPRDFKCRDVSGDGLTLTWMPPRDDGGSPVTHYVIEQREALRMSWTQLAFTKDTMFRVQNLNEGTNYLFRVVAVNEVGSSSPEELDKTITVKPSLSPPQQPQAPEPTNISKESISLNWPPWRYDGSPHVTGYHVEQRSLTRPNWVRLTTFPIRNNNFRAGNLTDDGSYQFRIIAENEAGLSEPSAATQPLTPRDPWSKPGPPEGLRVSDVTKHSCNLTWNPPSYDGDDDVRGYVIEVRKGGYGNWNKVNIGHHVLEPNFKMTGLSEDVEYEFRVAAENRAGLGACSDVTPPIRTKNIVECSYSCYFLGLNITFSFCFCSPTCVYSVIVHYSYIIISFVTCEMLVPVHSKEPSVLSPMVNISALQGETVKLECDVLLGKPRANVKWFKDGQELQLSNKYSPGYSNDSAYLSINNVQLADAGVYTCEAYNQHGRVKTTARLTVHVPPLIEKTSQVMYEVKRGSTIHLPINYSSYPPPKVTWRKNGLPLVHIPGRIMIETRDHGFSTLTLSGVEPEDAARYEIEVENVAGVARLQIDIIVKSPPSSPTNMRILSMETDSVTLAWDQPEIDGGSPITGYVIDKSDAARGPWTTVGRVDNTARSYKVTRLLPGSRYNFRVSGENDVGVGYSLETREPIEIRTIYEIPEPPRYLELIDSNKSSVTLQWQPPRGQVPIQGYNIEKRSAYSSGPFTRLNATPILDTYYIDKIIFDSGSYEYRVISIGDDGGESQPSDVFGPIVVRDLFGKPSTPSAPTVSVINKNSVQLIWTPPRSTGGASVTNYIIEYKTPSYYGWVPYNMKGQVVTQPHHVIDDLIEGTAYEFRISAENRAGLKVPTIHEHITDFTAKPNTDASFKCRLFSDLTYNVVWLKDNERLPATNKYATKIKDNVAELIIHDVTEMDRGIYTCEVSNKYGRITSSAALYLAELPRVDFDSRLRHQLVPVGGVARINLTYDADPAPTVTWYKNGVVIKSRGNVSVDNNDVTTWLTIRNVKMDDGGEYEVIVKNEWGMCREKFIVQVVDVPGQPTDVKVSEIGADHVKLEWRTPKYNGGCAIDRYIIERKEVNSNYWLPVGVVPYTQTNVMCNGLRPGADHVMRVFAENQLGVGEPGYLVVPVRIKAVGGHEIEGDLPGVRGLRHVNVSLGEVTLEWQPPLLESKYKLINYVIEKFEGPPLGKWVKVVMLPASVHRYKVKDVREDLGVKLRIYGETNDGLFLNYVIYDVPPYEKAEKKARPSSTVLTFGVPSRPIGPIIVNKLSPCSLELEWRPPLHDGESKVTGYIIEMCEGVGEWKKIGYVPSSDNEFTVAGLTPGHEYFFRISAESSAGVGPPLQSDTISASAPTDASRRLRYKNLKKGAVTLKWGKSDDEENEEEDEDEEEDEEPTSSITGYLIEKMDFTGADKWTPVHKVPAKARSYEVPGLLPDHKYAFRVRPLIETEDEEAVKSPGQYKDYRGAPLLMSQNLRLPLSPQGPLLVSKLANDDVIIRWRPPLLQSSDQLPITGYVVQVRESDKEIWTRDEIVGGVTTSYVLRNLLPGKKYQVKVIAKNRDGESAPLISTEYINVGDVNVVEVPSAPQSLRIVRVTDDAISLRWQAPKTDGGSEITKYIVLMKSKPFDIWEEVCEVDGYSTGCTIGDLRSRSVRSRGSISAMDGSGFFFAVFAINEKGRSDQIETTLPVQLRRSSEIKRLSINAPFKISPIGPLVVTAFSDDSVSLSWRPFTDSDVTGYRVEMRESGQLAWQHVSSVDAEETSYVVRNLREGTDYQFRVLAENSGGSSSPPITLDTPFSLRQTYLGKPGSPRGPLETNDISKDSVTLTWLPPLSDGGATINSYIIERKDLLSNRWVRVARVKPFTTSYTVSNLIPGSEYLFRIIAENSEGQGLALTCDRPVTLHKNVLSRPPSHSRPPSKSRLSVTTEAPAPPRGPLVVSNVGKNNLTLSWQPSFFDLDLNDLTSGYVIEKCDVTSGFHNNWIRVNKVKSYVNSYDVNHLVEGHLYKFRVIAENHLGRSQALESRESVQTKTPNNIPGPPYTVRLVGITEDSLTIEWTDPVSDGGDPIHSYVIEKKESKSSHWISIAHVPATERRHVIKNLQSSCSYFVRVAAENSEGVGYYREFTEPVTPTKPKDLPSAPLNFKIENATRESVTLSWLHPSESGGVPLAGFQVEQQEGCVGGSGVMSKWHTVGRLDSYTTQYTVHGLVQGLEYNFRVRAENAVGVGSACGLANPIVPSNLLSRPLPPAMLEVVSTTHDSITLSWLPPESDGGSKILSYVVEQREVGGADATWFPVKRVDSNDSLVACIGGLIEGTPYLFRIYAENKVGPGGYVQLKSHVTPRYVDGRPLKPGGPLRVIRVTRNMLALHWSPPYDDSSYQVLRYVIEKKDDHDWTVAGVCPGDVTAYCVTDLFEDQPYYFRVVAETSAGRSEPLDMDLPVVPKRVFESAAQSDLEKLYMDSSLEPYETSDHRQKMTSSTNRQFFTYSDEPLTSTSDYLSLSDW
ncbi:hypothetical protein HELRODRAFT_191479 [Helobdella robusta]|uniref:Twitchin n=1 Tax=Helobdella robusta TaxID=6412 RepID=T1FT08_HELRO|nr:hypothetical protein HELRODRAFT_191479 [Helobdella robusta]ESO04852.1 hypothetical protein HELRODRAFT_191479 [Helobdella robusta]